MERLYKNEWMKPQCWAAALVLAVAVPAYAAPELYRWIDADGSVRYTPNPSRVPNARRDTLVRVAQVVTDEVQDARLYWAFIACRFSDHAIPQR